MKFVPSFTEKEKVCAIIGSTQRTCTSGAFAPTIRMWINANEGATARSRTAVRSTGDPCFPVDEGLGVRVSKIGKITI